MRVYIGTYTRDTGSEGIYRGELDIDSGELAVQGVAARVDNPSFLALSEARDFLYAVNEVSDLGAGRHGAASAFRVAPDGALTPAGQILAGASGPCHVCAHPSGELVFAANYGGGALSMFRCTSDGDLAERLATIDHEGSSVNPERQQEPHPHSVNLSPDGAYLYVPDLGIDRIVIYRVDVAAGTLTRAGETATAAGAGPRHFTFHPRGRVAYGINELDSTITAYAYGATDGSLTVIQTVPTLPAGYAGVSSPAPTSTCTPTGASCTAPTAATTASPSSQPAATGGSNRWATSPPRAGRRATSRSIHPAPCCWPPTRTATPSSRSASTPPPASWMPPATSPRFPPRCAWCRYPERDRRLRPRRGTPGASRRGGSEARVLGAWRNLTAHP